MSDDLTRAVDAAARECYEVGRREAIKVAPNQESRMPTWEESTAYTKLLWRQEVLPIVKVALEALPNRDRSLWLEGYYANDAGIREEACPYPLV